MTISNITIPSIFVVLCFSSATLNAAVTMTVRTLPSPTYTLDFDEIGAPSPGAVSGTDSYFTSNGISRVARIGTFIAGSDTLSVGARRNALGSISRREDSLAVVAPFGALDTVTIGAGFDFSFTDPISAFQIRLVDEENFTIKVELLLGVSSVGTMDFSIPYAANQSHASNRYFSESGGALFDRFKLTHVSPIPDNSGGWGVDNLALLVPEPSPEPADFDHDRDVDDNDLFIWQQFFGFSDRNGQPANDLGDANEDGDVDGGDFLFWQREFGSGSGTVSAAVPEPTSILLLAMGFVTAASCRRAAARGNRRRRCLHLQHQHRSP